MAVDLLQDSRFINLRGKVVSPVWFTSASVIPTGSPRIA